MQDGHNSNTSCEGLLRELDNIYKEERQCLAQEKYIVTLKYYFMIVIVDV